MARNGCQTVCTVSSQNSTASSTHRTTTHSTSSRGSNNCTSRPRRNWTSSLRRSSSMQTMQYEPQRMAKSNNSRFRLLLLARETISKTQSISILALASQACRTICEVVGTISKVDSRMKAPCVTWSLRGRSEIKTCPV